MTSKDSVDMVNVNVLMEEVKHYKHEAERWHRDYYVQLEETRKAHRGIKRLKKKLKSAKTNLGVSAMYTKVLEREFDDLDALFDRLPDDVDKLKCFAKLPEFVRGLRAIAPHAFNLLMADTGEVAQEDLQPSFQNVVIEEAEKRLRFYSLEGSSDELDIPDDANGDFEYAVKAVVRGALERAGVI